MTVTDQRADRPVVPAAGPRKAPAAVLPAVLLVLLALGLGVVALRDWLTHLGVFTGTLWTTNTVDAVDGVRRAGWLLPVGVVVALLGLLVVVAALRPRRRTHRRAESSEVVWLRPVDLARAASAAASGAADVATATSSVSGRKVTTKVTAHPAADKGSVRDGVSSAVSAALTPLLGSPRVKVRVRSAAGK